MSGTVNFATQIGLWMTSFIISIYLLSQKETYQVQFIQISYAFFGKETTLVISSFLKKVNEIFRNFIGGQLLEEPAAPTKEDMTFLGWYADIDLTEKYDFKEMLKSFLQAFIAGGFVSIIGQTIIDIYSRFTDKKEAILYMTLTVILVVGILTAIGVYDNIGQVCKCGLSIPISGFVNATVSSALEYKKEGIVLGIGSNIFKLSGSVLALGSCSAIVVAAIRYLFWVLG